MKRIFLVHLILACPLASPAGPSRSPPACPPPAPGRSCFRRSRSGCPAGEREGESWGKVRKKVEQQVRRRTKESSPSVLCSSFFVLPLLLGYYFRLFALEMEGGGKSKLENFFGAAAGFVHSPPPFFACVPFFILLGLVLQFSAPSGFSPPSPLSL